MTSNSTLKCTYIYLLENHQQYKLKNLIFIEKMNVFFFVNSLKKMLHILYMFLYLDYLISFTEYKLTVVTRYSVLQSILWILTVKYNECINSFVTQSFNKIFLSKPSK